MLPHVKEILKTQQSSWNNATNIWFTNEEEAAFTLAGGPMVAANDALWGVVRSSSSIRTLLPKNEHNFAVCPIVPVCPGVFLGIFAGKIRFSDDFNRVHGILGPMEKLWLYYLNVIGVLNQMKVLKYSDEANVQLCWELVNY
jgi:hypothetical protein